MTECQLRYCVLEWEDAALLVGHNLGRVVAVSTARILGLRLTQLAKSHCGYKHQNAATRNVASNHCGLPLPNWLSLPAEPSRL
jgi:hypothetical protein